MILGTICSRGAGLPVDFVLSLMRVKEYTWITQQGPSIPINRNEVFERARFEGDSLLFIDSDMVFKPEDIKRMESLLKEHDIVSGLAVMSWHGNPPAIFKIEGKGYQPHEPTTTEVFEIDGCGGAFLGISKKVLDTLTEPFIPLREPKTGQYYGEDISFCRNAKDAGFKIYCDPSLKIGHIKSDIKYPK